MPVVNASTVAGLPGGDEGITDAAEAASVIAELVAGIEPAAPEIADANVQRDPTLNAAPEEAAPEKKAVEKVVEKPADKPAEDDNSRGLLRLMEREDAVRAREAEFEKKVAAYEKRLNDAESASKKGPDLAAIKRRLLTAPADFIEKELGIAPEQVTRLIIAQKLGASAPAELIRMAKDAEMERAQDEQREELVRLRREISRERVRPAVDEHVAKTDDKGASKYPALVAALTKDKGKTSARLWEKVNAVAGDGELSDEVYEKAAKELDAEYTYFRDLFGTPATSATDTKQASDAATETAPKTAKNEKPEPKTTRSAPPARAKKPYWLQEDDADYVDSTMRDVIAIAKQKH